MNKGRRIGARDSELALWQAHAVEKRLNDLGYATAIIAVKSTGDIILDKPLYELGITCIFTKTLDIAMIKGEVDIAVHSMKDVPVVLPQGITQAAVLKRGSYKDLLVAGKGIQFINNEPVPDQASPFIIATSSIRRKAQWLHRYPGSRMENLRGNVNTRLKKLAESEWNGAIFAAAGLERVGLRPENSIELDWMLPAPAQGAIMVVCRLEDRNTWNACQPMNDEHTATCVKAERDFLRTLMGGCSTPISALASVNEGRLKITGNILSHDGTQKLEVEKETSLEKSYSLGVDAALEILDNGGGQLMEAIRNSEG